MNGVINISPTATSEKMPLTLKCGMKLGPVFMEGSQESGNCGENSIQCRKDCGDSLLTRRI